MNPAHALTTPPSTRHGPSPDSKNTVNHRLTPKRARPVVENDAYAAFAHRILAAYARRIAIGDIDALALLTGLSADIDPMARGVGWLLAESGVPRRIKAAYLDDDTIKYLAAYAARLRGSAAA